MTPGDDEGRRDALLDAPPGTGEDVLRHHPVEELAMQPSPAHVDGLTLLDPAYGAVVADTTVAPLTRATLPDVRAQMQALAPALTPPTIVASTEHTVAAPDGYEVALRVYRPTRHAGALPCVYGIHGGGYVMGSRNSLDRVFHAWCDPIGLVGVSVEYRLAPEHTYPAALDDCYAGLSWVAAHHDEIGIDPMRIGVQGSSAGGGLAAAVALLARDQGDLQLAFQVLECPMLDDRFVTTSSTTERLQVWSRESNEFGWRAYLGDRFGTGDVPIYAAPARATDLTGLPPAIVCAGGADGFRDEDIDYGRRLCDAGVPTELHVYPGVPHGAGIVPDAPATKQWARDVEDWVARQVHRPAGS